MSNELRDQQHLMDIRDDFLTKALRYGFAAELSMTEAQYTASIPTPPLQPTQWEGRFDILLPIEWRIPFSRQCVLAYGKSAFAQEGRIFSNFVETPTDKFEWAYAQDGANELYLGKSGYECRHRLFGPDERGLTVAEVVSLYIFNDQFREMLFNPLNVGMPTYNGVIAAGSYRGTETEEPIICVFAGLPGPLIGGPDPHTGVGSRGVWEALQLS
jgi:hypothetical protein